MSVYLLFFPHHHTLGVSLSHYLQTTLLCSFKTTSQVYQVSRQVSVTNFVTLDQSRNLSGPQFPHLKKQGVKLRWSLMCLSAIVSCHFVIQHFTATIYKSINTYLGINSGTWTGWYVSVVSFCTG